MNQIKVCHKSSCSSIPWNEPKQIRVHGFTHPWQYANDVPQVQVCAEMNCISENADLIQASVTSLQVKMTPSLAVVLANEIRHTLRFLKYPWYMSIIVLWKLQENIAYLNYNFCMFLNLCLKLRMTQKYQINNTKL